MPEAHRRSLPELIKTAKALQVKAEQAAKKADQFYVSLGLTLAELKDRKPGGVRWPDFVRKHFGYSRERADELIRIGAGSTTVEAVRSKTVARVQKHRAADPVLRNTGSTPAPTRTMTAASTPEIARTDYDPSADEMKPGDDGYDEMMLNEKADKTGWDAIRLLRQCMDGIGTRTPFEKGQLHETLQALKVLQEVLQEVYRKRFADDGLKTEKAEA